MLDKLRVSDKFSIMSRKFEKALEQDLFAVSTEACSNQFNLIQPLY